ncbi:MAG: trypsin-like serine protease [Geitlerinemataceae cyanobacterium]
MTELIQPLRHPRIGVPTNNPDDPSFFVQPGTGLDGVVAIARGGTIQATGALLYSGRHILTAAHVFNFDAVTPNLDPNEAEYTVFFDLPGGRVPVAVSRISINPLWEGDRNFNNDIAIVELAQFAPPAADRYQIYTEGDEVFQTITRVGYGNKGTGNGGEVLFDPTPIKRQGLNRYDAFGEIFNTNPFFQVVPGTQLAYDFDNGLLQNDAFGQELRIFDTGFGVQEVAASRGDDGGPSLIDGKIAGIFSYGFSPPRPGIDVTAGQNDGSFGEIFVDTRVLPYGGYINQIIATTNQGDDRIPGNNRNDFLAGNQGNDTIDGFGGDDVLFGGRDNDILSGGEGNDSLLGNRGNDGLNGDRGDDVLFGGQDDDVLTGGDGNDRLSGDLGRDILIGGFGSDEFILRTAAAVIDPNQADIIADFAPGDDRIALNGVRTPEDVLTLPEGLVLTPTTLAGLAGTLIQLPAQPPETPPEQLLPTILGFVSNASVADVASRLVAIDDII